MLIIYDKVTGTVLDSSGTSSVEPLGPTDDRAYINTDARGIDRASVALLRLHDEDDADLVGRLLTHEHLVVKGKVVVGAPHAPAPVPEPAPDPVEVLLADLDKQTTLAGYKAAMRKGLPAALGRGR